MKAASFAVPVVAAVIGVLAGRASVAGRTSVAERMPDPAHAASGAPSTSDATATARADAVAARASSARAGRTGATEAPDDGAVPPPADVARRPLHATRDAGPDASCEAQLEAADETLRALERHRHEREGDPIPPRDDVAPRFGSAGLVRTFDDAFRATRIKGGVETVDCSEFPCIAFGRLSGDEAMVAELEDSKFFAQYDDDVGVMLTWASGDHEREGAPKEGVEREKPPEISLFAFAFYGHEDKRKLGEAIDRRIRTRTAEYWNASRPDE